MRCPKCGNENGEGNRFCGMCGAPLTAGAPAASSTAKAPPTAAMAGQTPGRSPAQETRPERTAGNPAATNTSPAKPSPVNTRVLPSFDPQREEPRISGPSFLGLNQPGPARSGRGDYGRDQPHNTGNLDYLLQDDEYEEPKRGWGKVLLVLVALALAGGFGYLHWKQGGFNWLMAGGNKPAATPAPADTGQPSADNSGAAPPSVAPGTTAGGNNTGANGTPNTSSAPSAGGTAATPSETPSTQTATPQGTAPAAAPGSAAPITEAPANSAAGSAGPAGTAPALTNEPQTPAGPASGAGAAAAPAASAAQAPDEEQPQAAAAAPPKAAPKPRAARPAPPKPSNVVTEANQYIYGRGVGQDCDRGMRMLKSASRTDANAMIALGVLYSTGTCAPRDLPTAYRYFAMGLHKEPDNQALQDDLQQLWSQMTQPERQLAIKLSQ